jgi:microcystin-dependent protein
MSNPFLGQIKMFAGNFAPVGWLFCQGQILSISQNTALFSLLGTTYGGNGTSTFALPNLQGCFVMSSGQGPGLSPRDLGETGGEAAVTLLTTSMPAHTHNAEANTAGGNTDSPTGADWAFAHKGKAPIMAYTASESSNVPMNAEALAPAGGSQPHNNLPPYLVINFIIATQGIFPSRN